MYAGLRLPGDQRQMTPALPMHLVDLLPVGDGVHTFSDASGNSQYFVIYCSFWPNTRFYSNSCEHFSKLFSILQVCTWRTLHLCHQTALVTKGICYRLNVGSFLKFHLLDLFVCFVCNVKVGNDTCSADSHFFFLQCPLLKSHFSSSFCRCTVVSLESMLIISLFSFPYKLQRNEMTIVVHRFSLLFTSPLFISIHSSLSLPCNVLDALWFTSSSLMDASFVLSKWETPGWILSFLFFFLIGTCGKMCHCLSSSSCISWF